MRNCCSLLAASLSSSIVEMASETAATSEEGSRRAKITSEGFHYCMGGMEIDESFVSDCVVLGFCVCVLCVCCVVYIYIYICVCMCVC